VPPPVWLGRYFAQVYVLTLTIFQFNVVQDDLSENPNWAYVGLVRLPPEGDGTRSPPPHRNGSHSLADRSGRGAGAVRRRARSQTRAMSLATTWRARRR